MQTATSAVRVVAVSAVAVVALPGLVEVMHAAAEASGRPVKGAGAQTRQAAS